MKRWLTLAGLFGGALLLGYWAAYTFRFFEGVLPHGGMW